jgi:hypothetical protein
MAILDGQPGTNADESDTLIIIGDTCGAAETPDPTRYATGNGFINQDAAWRNWLVWKGPFGSVGNIPRDEKPGKTRP